VKRYRILLMVHEQLVPPEDIEGLSEKEIDVFRSEYNVYSTLYNLGHEVRVVGISDQLSELREMVKEWKPHVVFNLLQEFSGITSYEHHVVAYLEMIRQQYTGCNPRGLMLSRDKVLTKQLLAWHRIATPAFHLFPFGVRFMEPKEGQAEVSAVREIGHGRRVGGNCAGLHCRGHAPAARARGVHSRPCTERRAGRGIHRRARVLHWRAGQQAIDDAADLGDRLRHAGREAQRYRHEQGQMGSRLPGQARHHDGTCQGDYPRRRPTRWHVSPSASTGRCT
jgi:hypothetical protein